jgi:BNR repeat protein
MKARNFRTVGSILLTTLLLSSLLIIANSGASSAKSAAADEIAAAFGSNRFVVWMDKTSGNFEILFRRSTDNGATWKPLVNLSDNPGDSRSPQVVVSGSNVYVVWQQLNANSTAVDVFLRRSTDNGATWQSKVNLSQSSGSEFPQIVVSGSGVFVVWQDTTLGNFDIFFRRSTDNGATWKPKVNLSNDPARSDSPQIAVSGSNVYVVWFDRTPGNFDIFSRRSADSGVTWKAVKNLSDNPGDSRYPQIVVSGANVYVVWFDRTPGNADIFFTRSTDSGATWKTVMNLSNDADRSRFPQIAVSGANVYVVWQSGDPSNSETFFRRSTDNGAKWQSKVNLSQSSGSEFPQIVVSGSNVYVVWFDRTGGNAETFFRRSADSGVTWKAVKNLSDNPGGSIFPQIVVSGANVYVVWQDSTSTPGYYDIFFTRSTDSGVTWKAVKNLSDTADHSELPELGL